MTDELREKYPANSFDEKEVKTEPTVKKVASGRLRKKTLGDKLRDVLILGDFKEAIQTSIEDVAIPYLKDLLCDSAINLVESIFHGEGGSVSYRRRGHSGPYRDYTKNYERDTRQANPRGDRFEIESVIFTTPEDAEDVLTQMIDVIDQSDEGWVTVADFFMFSGVSSDYVARKWGWRNLSNARPKRVSDGYILKMPRPESLG